MNRRSGITLTSIVIYVSLFFVFTVFAVAMSTNMNYRALDEKANIYIHEQFSKFEYNIVSSAKTSNSVDNIVGRVVFSNNDEYSFDSNKKVILKNGGVLVKSVENFRVIDTNKLDNVGNIALSNIDDKVDYVCLEITLKKYGKQIVKQLFVTVGD